MSNTIQNKRLRDDASPAAEEPANKKARTAQPLPVAPLYRHAYIPWFDCGFDCDAWILHVCSDEERGLHVRKVLRELAASDTDHQKGGSRVFALTDWLAAGETKYVDAELQSYFDAIGPCPPFVAEKWEVLEGETLDLPIDSITPYLFVKRNCF